MLTILCYLRHTTRSFSLASLTLSVIAWSDSVQTAEAVWRLGLFGFFCATRGWPPNRSLAYTCIRVGRGFAQNKLKYLKNLLPTPPTLQINKMGLFTSLLLLPAAYTYPIKQKRIGRKKSIDVMSKRRGVTQAERPTACLTLDVEDNAIRTVTGKRWWADKRGSWSDSSLGQSCFPASLLAKMITPRCYFAP